ncbi:MAG: AsmA-like C-terminal region-containing protein [Phycisphaeraceae bacterium]
MCCGLALLLVTLVAGVFLTRPHRLAWITAGVLERLTGADVRIDLAHLSFDGGLELQGVRFAVPDLPNDYGRLGEIEIVRMTPDLWALGRGQVRLRSIVLLQPTLYLTRHADDDRYNYQHLIHPRIEPGQQWLIDALPEVFVRHGTLEFAERDDRTTRSLGTMDVEGRLTRDPDQPAVYRFTLRQEGDELLPGVVFHGSLDLTQQRVSTELQGFQFTEAQQQLLPAELRTLWQKLAPSGTMPTLTLSYDQADDGGLDAELRMQDVAMNVPVPGIDSRMHDVTGVFRLRGERLTIEQLTGEIEGIRYRFAGEVGGFDLDAPVRLHLETDEFAITETPPPYIAGMPEPVQRQYGRYQPTGRFQATFELHREVAGGPLEYEGTVDVRDAAGRWEKFPVPIHGVNGQVHITHERIRIIDMRGRGPNGGEVVVEGTVTPPGRDPAADIRVSVRSAPMDDFVLAALKPEQRRVALMFMNPLGHAELVSAGLIRAQPTMPWQWRDKVLASVRGEPAAPIFALGGRLHAEVHATRAAGPGQPVLATIDLAPDGPVNLLLDKWHYPLQMIAGRVVIAPGTVHVDNVRVRGLTGAAGMIDGWVGWNKDDPSDIRPDLHILDAELPVDPLLLTSVPAPQDRWMRAVGVSGHLTAHGNITNDAEGETDFAITFNLDGGRARPLGGPFAFDDVAGQVVLHRRAIEIEQFHARHEEATLAGQGAAEWAEDEEPSVNLTLTGQGLALDAGLLDLLPDDHHARPRIAELFEQYQPTGRFDAELALGDDAGPDATPFADGAPPYRLRLHPRSLRLMSEGDPVDFHELTGGIVVAGGQAELEDLTARFDAGRITASGPVMLEAGGSAALRLSGELERLDGPWLSLLPERLRDTLASLDVHGKVTLEHARLLARPRATEGPQLELAGLLALEAAQLNAGLPMEELAGTLTFDFARFADRATPQAEILLEAERLVVSDRLIAPLTLELRTDEASNALQIEQLRGEVYGGVLVGTGAISLRAPGPYQLELALQDVHVDPFLAAGETRRAQRATANPDDASVVNDASNATVQTIAAPAPPPAPLPDADAATGRGRLNASFTVQGELGQPDSRRGRGEMEIRHAQIYERPLAMAMLQAVNFSLPLSGSFDRGAASFLLEGDTVYFDDLALEAPSLTIRGAGTMHYPTGALDLHLRARNPAGPHLGVISDMLNLVKDQLVGIRITGTFDAPRARVVGLEDLRRPWTDAFNPKPDDSAAPAE